MARTSWYGVATVCPYTGSYCPRGRAHPAADYQLGNGKRSSLAVPQHLPPLITRAIADVGLSKEASISSGAVCPSSSLGS
jgi:hypothetical protein